MKNNFFLKPFILALLLLPLAKAVLSQCTVAIPGNATLVHPANPLEQYPSGPFWVCAGNTLDDAIGGGETVFLENGATFNNSGGGSHTIYMKSGSHFTPGGGGSHTIYFEPGADTSGIGPWGSPTFIPCSSITFDYTNAPQCGCFSSFPPASITAAGPVTFCWGGSVTLNANTGAGYSYEWRNGHGNTGGTTSSHVAMLGGVYSVRITDNSNGCFSTSNSITITAFQHATMQHFSVSTTTCQGDPVMLFGNSNVGLVHQWLLNGNAISGAIQPSYPADETGDYSVITDVNGCPDTSDAITITANICSGNCVFVIPSNAKIITGNVSSPPSGSNYWVCSGSTLGGGGGGGRTIFLEGAATFNNGGGGSHTVYMKAGSHFTPGGGGSHTIYFEPGADTSGIGPFGSPTFISCSSITFDYTNAPAGNCPTAVNIIRGTVFNDQNANCTIDTAEQGLNRWLVKAEPGSYFGYMNTNGNYSMYLPAGNYTLNLTQIDADSLREVVCPPGTFTHSLNLPTADDTIENVDFGVKTTVFCPVLTVDLSTSFLRLCPQSDFLYYLNYCNNGTEDAQNVYIVATLDTLLHVSSSTPPWTSQNLNNYRFNIGTVTAGACSTITLSYRLSCSATLGQTICSTAKIYPDTRCFPANSSWDNSHIIVTSNCESDSLACFIIRNAGTGDMQGASVYRIYENNVLKNSTTFQLNAGDSMVVCYPALGNTVRVEANQRPGYPGGPYQQAHVELCGQPPFVLGQVITVPIVEEAFTDIDCQEVIGSWDPNDKQVIPAGITGEHHYIKPTDKLEYLIRFQNTGTDTAFKVVVMDTLSPHLDITTFKAGVSSHPYSIDILEDDILRWTFDHIMLPDSNVNEAESHGFVKFKIEQKSENPNETRIENTAAIYFDSNAPVITNTTFNTIGADKSVSPGMGNLVYDKKYAVKTFPNPFQSTVIFEVTGISGNESFSLEIYNIVGENIRTVTNIRESKFTLKRGDLPGGMYIYFIRSSNRLIGTGKIVAQ